jgi:hypothetical protein
MEMVEMVEILRLKKRLLDLRGIPLYLLYDAHKTLHYISGRPLS